jgi:hypothetical protein
MTATPPNLTRLVRTSSIVSRLVVTVLIFAAGRAPAARQNNCPQEVRVVVGGWSKLNRFYPVNIGKVAGERPAMQTVLIGVVVQTVLIGVVVAVLPSALTVAWLMWRSGAFDSRSI